MLSYISDLILSRINLKKDDAAIFKNMQQTHFSVFVLYLTLSRVEATLTELFSSNSKQYFRRRGMLLQYFLLCCKYAANLFYKKFYTLHSQRLKLHWQGYFHPIISSILEEKYAAAIFAIWLQLCQLGILQSERTITALW